MNEASNKKLFIQNFFKIVKYVMWIYLIAQLFSIILPNAFDALSKYFVLKGSYRGADSTQILMYSGSTGLFSEPSYQALFSLQIFLGMIFMPRNILKVYKPKDFPDLKIIILQAFVSTMLSRSLTAVLYIVFFGLLYLLIYISSLLSLSRLPSLTLTSLIYIVLSLGGVYFLTRSERFQGLINFFQESIGDILKNPFETFLSLENKFGSNRFFATFSDSINSSGAYGIDNLTFKITAFSPFLTLSYIYTIYAALFVVVIICSLFFVKYSIYCEFRPFIFALASFLFYGPISLPFAFMPIVFMVGCNRKHENISPFNPRSLIQGTE